VNPLTRLLTHLFPSPTPDARRAAELSPLPDLRVESPAPMPCAPEDPCPACRTPLPKEGRA
jgi:hypothetical protein